MRFSTILLVLAILLPKMGVCEAPTPIAKYTLHARKERTNGFCFCAAAQLPGTIATLDKEKNVLLFIPQTNGGWVLKRLRNWNTTRPVEDTLEITDKEQSNDVAIHPTLTLSENGHYLVVRLTYVNRVDPNGIDAASMINIVDLRTFQSLSQITTRDPLLNGSQWKAGANENTLLTKGLATFRKDMLASSYRNTSHYVAGILDLPNLTPHDRCEYDSLTESKKDGIEWTSPKIENASKGCETLTQKAHIRSLADLPGPKEMSYLHPLGNFGCTPRDTDSGRQLVLEECREGHSDGELFFITSSHEWIVKSTSTKRTILSVPLSHSWAGLTELLATVGDETYAILVKQGVHIEVYRVPR